MKINQFFLPASSLQQKILYLLMWITIMLAWFYYHAHFYPYFFPADDPYIVMHSAQVLHWGADPNYAGVPALAGITSPVYLAWIALLISFMQPVTAVMLTQWLGVVLYATALLTLAFRYRASPLQAIGFLIVCMLNGRVPYHLLNGLETGLAMALLTWMLLLATLPETRCGRYILPALCGLAPFIRPELGLFVILLFLQRAFAVTVKNKTGRFTGASQQLLRDISLALLLALPWILWSWLTLGTPYPQTLAAKTAYFAVQSLPMLIKLKMAVKQIWDWWYVYNYLLMMLMSILLVFTSIGRVGIIFFILLFSIYAYFGADEFYVNHSRYFYVFMPLLFYGIAANLTHRKHWLSLLANLTLFAGVMLALSGLPVQWRDYQDARYFSLTSLTSVTQWAEKNLPAHATILIHDAGYLSVATSFHLVDMVGLKTPGVIPINAHYAGKSRSTALAKIICIYHPQYLIVRQDWDNGFHVVAGLRQQGWQLQELHYPVSIYSYAVYAIKPYVDMR